jgi:hypothetical protein
VRRIGRLRAVVALHALCVPLFGALAPTSQLGVALRFKSQGTQSFHSRTRSRR